MIGYHLYATQSAYEQALVDFIASLEGHITNATNIGDGKATIGYGYTFNRSDNLAIWTNAGIGLTNAEIATLQLIDGTPASQQTNVALTQFMRTITLPEAKALLAQTYPAYEVTANELGMPLSRERVAFVSITYNRGIAAARNKMKDFYAAVQAGDRSEAWFQIRYNAQTSDSQYVNGIANRRYKEAEMFSLYDDVGALRAGSASAANDADAKAAYRMWTRHRDTRVRAGGVIYGGILTYEAVFNPANAQITNIEQQLNPAHIYLSQHFVSAKGLSQTIDWQNIYVGEDGQSIFSLPVPPYDDSDHIKGSENSDLIFGERGDDWLEGKGGADVIYGGAGDDHIYGGAGDDYIEGGADNDTYYVNTGDGTDQIEDKQGNNTVVINGVPIKFFVRSDGQTDYRTTDNRFTAVLQNGDLIVTDTQTGTRVILNEDFQEGDFGIELKDLGPDPATTFSWAPFNRDWTKLRNGTSANDYDGSPDFVDFDGNGTDDITSIHTTSADEVIHGGAGDDFIDGHGGTDKLYGDDGNDTLYFYFLDPTGDSLADGGAGRDLIFGESSGNNHLIGGLDSDLSDEGDLLINGLGNDHLEGGRGDDALFDYAGEDLLEGGRGNDYLFSGVSVGFVSAAMPNNWSIQPVSEVIAGVERNGNVYEFPAPAISGFGALDYSLDSDNQGDFLFGGAGSDYLMGGRGDDYLDAGSDDDTSGDTNVLFAGLGDDIAAGGAGRDWFFGDGGADSLFGSAGDDMLFGDDVLSAGGVAGDDYLDGGAGQDEIYGHGGNDTLVGGTENDTLLGGVGVDTIYGDEGDDHLQGGDGTGGDGDDVLFGGAGNDTLIGEEGDDYLIGGDGADTLVGGLGADTLDGGAGADLIYRNGNDRIILDGADQVNLINEADLPNQIDPTSGFTLLAQAANLDQLQLRQIQGPDGRQYLHVVFDAENSLLLQNGFIDNGQLFEFGGEALTQQAIMATYAPAVNLVGTATGDKIYGSQHGDTINGGAGDDILDGQGGDDLYIADSTGDVVAESVDNGTDTVQAAASFTLGANIENLTLTGTASIDGTGNALNNTLTGNAADNVLAGVGGNDAVNGGAGNDTYLFGVGDGADVIVDTAGVDAIRFGTGITTSDFSVFRNGNDLIVSLNADDRFTVSGWFNGNRIEQFIFESGATLNASDVEARVVANAPTLAAAIADQSATEDGAFTFAVPNNTFADSDARDALTYSATRVDGSALPSWLTFDAASRTFTGTPGNGDVGAINVRITATDLSGLSVSDVFALTVANTNDAPTVNSAIADQAITEGTTFTFQVPAGTFGDIDAGDSLTHSANRADGSALPVWLAFDAATRTFSGTPGGNDAGAYDIRVVATDQSGASVSDTFTLNVADVPYSLIVGTSANDTLTGGAANDTIRGLDGDDTLNGQGGIDTLYGGAGADTLIGGDADDQLFGEAGNDFLVGGNGADWLEGGSGNDRYRLTFGVGADTIFENDATVGNSDTITVASGINPANVIVTRSNNDLRLSLNGTADSFTVRDFFVSPVHQVEQVTFDSDSTTVWNAATLSYFANGTYGSNNGEVLNGGSGNDGLFGLGGDDTLNGADGDDMLDGGVGNDTLDGGTGRDILIGGGGNDIFRGGAGNDTYRVSTADLTTGFSLNMQDTQGSDRAEIPWGIVWNGNNFSASLQPSITGTTREGDDLLVNVLVRVYSGVSRPDVTGQVRLTGHYTAGGEVEYLSIGDNRYATQAGAIDNAGFYWSSPISGFDWEYRLNIGSTFRDSVLVSGGSGDDILSGVGGNSPVGQANFTYFYGHGGNDRMVGNSWADHFHGGSGNDRMEGRRGDDTYYINPDEQDVILDNGTGDSGVSDTIVLDTAHTLNQLTFTRQGNDLLINSARVERYFERDVAQTDPSRIYPYAIETLQGQNWQINLPDHLAALELYDPINGTEDADLLSGSALSDRMYGLGGNDSLYGRDGNDRLYGGAGTDTLFGEVGDDTLDGGAEDDALLGGFGNDTYRVSRDGFERIYENNNEGTLDTIVFGDGITQQNITVQWNSGVTYDDGSGPATSYGLLWVDFGNNQGLLVEDELGGSDFEIESFRFADGTTLSLSQFLALDTDPTRIGAQAGTTGNDVLSGSNWNDQLYGNSGADVLIGRARYDQLYGQSGNDILVGGAAEDDLFGDAGNDVYLFNSGDADAQASDYISDWASAPNGAGEVDTLSMGGGLRPQDLDACLEVGDNGDGSGYSVLYLRVRSTGETMLIDWTSTFDDGSGLVTHDLRLERLQFLGNGNDQIFNFAGLVAARESELRSAYDADPDNPAYIALFRPEDLTAFDITGTVPFAGGNHALQYATTGVVPLTPIQSVITGTESAETLTGTAVDDQIFGLGGNDTLNGNAGNDLLDGGFGADTMNGGSGNDTYVVENTGDITTESSSTGGIDTVLSSVTRTLGSNIEHLTLTGTAAINGTGNTLANTITGNSANNTLSGGTGADTLIGGAGNDIYVVDNSADVVMENANEGTDTIQTNITLSLATRANVENLTLTGTSAINATGNTLDNVLTGNGANNRLEGGAGNDTLNGGSGSDTMLGGTGDDMYVINVSTDVTTELANEGVDTIQSSITVSLSDAARANIENVTLTGSSAINATGNALNNVLIGNGVNNRLDGGTGNDYLDGGLGTDTMIGGSGDDTFVINTTSDVTTEAAGQGNDTLRSSITVSLTETARTNIENITLTGTSAINATGNSGNNVLIGNAGANAITGNAGGDRLDGGAGSDTLSGGTGNDTYIFNRGYGTDSITDSDTTAGNQDTALFGVNPLDLVLVRPTGSNNLQVRIHGTTDVLTINSWYSGASNHVERLQTQDNRLLLDTRVDQLIQAMSQFSANNGGITWDQAIDTRPQDVEAVISAYWQAA